MTIRQAFKRLYSEVTQTIYKPTFDIGFINDEGAADETQFTVSGSFSNAAGELSALFADFCRENGYKQNSVTSITLVNDN